MSVTIVEQEGEGARTQFSRKTNKKLNRGQTKKNKGKNGWKLPKRGIFFPSFERATHLGATITPEKDLGDFTNQLVWARLSNKFLTRAQNQYYTKKEGHLVGNDNNFEIFVFAIVT